MASWLVSLSIECLYRLIDCSANYFRVYATQLILSLPKKRRRWDPGVVDMNKLAPFCHSYDLCDLDLLPVGWQGDIMATIRRHGIQTCLDGTSSTSREPAGICPMRVTVVTGDQILESLPWLYSLYRTELAACASKFAGVPVNVSGDLPSSVNINLLEGRNARYERHVDSNPVTGRSEERRV